MLRRLNSKGDTIVEVLLAITVVSAVLAGAYVSTSRSLKANRAAQERAEATEFVQQQAERLKYVSSTSNAASVFASGPFCIKDDLTVQNVTNISNDSNCTFGARYVISITYAGGSSPHLIRALWENATGSSTVSIGGTSYPGYDIINLYYRVYP